MSADLPSVARIWLDPLSEFVRERLGLHFPENQWAVLYRNFMKSVGIFDFTDPNTCLQWLMQQEPGSESLHILAGCLTIGETYFFRERDHFEPMARHLFEEVIRRKRKIGHKQLRIWSAACSTGEEPYSIAIILDALLPDIHEWSIRILATDINPDFLEKARIATYRQWSFRGTPEWVRKRYFQTEADQHLLREDIRQRVTFDFLNLAEDIYPSLCTQTQAMDVIFCRNMLIYFSPDQAGRVVHRLQKSLVENGWLVLSPTETIYVTEPEMHRKYVQQAILFQKNSNLPTEQRKTPAPRSGDAPPHSCFQPLKNPPQSQVTFTSDRSTVNPPIASSREEPSESARIPVEKNAGKPSLIEELEAMNREGRYRETVERILTHLDGQPARGHEAFLLARAEANLGELDQALTHTLHALASDKFRPDYHYLLAMIQQERNESDEMERSLQRVLYLDEQHVMAHFTLGHLTLQQKRLNIAEKHFNRAQHLLGSYDSNTPLQEAEGITVERLQELISAGLRAVKA